MNRRLVGVLIMSWVFLSGMIGTGLVGPNRSSVEAEFGLSHGQFGLAVAAIQVVASFLALGVGPRLRRWSSYRVLMLGLAIQAVGFGAIYALHAVAGLVLGWALVNFGTVLGAVTNNISMHLWPGNARKGVTLLHACNGVGKIAGPLVVAACIVLSWRTSFLAVGLITALVLGAFFVSRRRKGVIPEDPRRALPAHGGGVLRDPFYWLSVLPFGMIAGGEAAFVTLMPAWFEHGHGYTPQGASLLLTVHLAGLATGRFLSGALSARVSNNAIIGGCLAAGVFVFPVVLGSSPAVVYPALFLMGLMFSSTWPTFYAQVARFHPGQRDMLAYGSSVANVLGISTCVLLSSLVADLSLRWSLLFGPAVLWLFGALYYSTRLSASAAGDEREVAAGDA